MASVYLDACCFIYLVEGTPTWRSIVEDRLRQLEPAERLVTSHLSRLECRSKPMADADASLLARYDALFGATRVDVVDVTASVIDRATDLRARYRFKTPDCIHLATAAAAGASAFWTGDAGLRRCSDVNVVVLSPP